MSISRKRFHEEGKAPAKKPKGKEDAAIQLHYGLYNQGATCYLNSVLQVLFMTPELHDRLDPNSWITDQELGEVFKKIKVENCGTEEITESLGITNVHQQCDAAECLELILHKVSPNASEVFQGQLIYMTKCSKGHIINEETNPFWTLPLSLRNTRDATYNVERGFERTFETKSYSRDNMVYCNECEKKTEATSGCDMDTFPQILVLLLKRFEFDFNTMSDIKSNCSVDVPYTLEKKDKKYSLYGMVNHYGSLRGGHYTATLLSNEDKTWYEFNDEAVNKVSIHLTHPLAWHIFKILQCLFVKCCRLKSNHLQKPGLIVPAVHICSCTEKVSKTRGKTKEEGPMMTKKTGMRAKIKTDKYKSAQIRRNRRIRQDMKRFQLSKTKTFSPNKKQTQTMWKSSWKMISPIQKQAKWK